MESFSSIQWNHETSRLFSLIHICKKACFVSPVIATGFSLLVTLHKKCRHAELFWSVFSRIRTKCWKMRTRITLNTDTFHAVPATPKSKFCNGGLTSMQSFSGALWSKRQIQIQKRFRVLYFQLICIRRAFVVSQIQIQQCFCCYLFNKNFS